MNARRAGALFSMFVLAVMLWDSVLLVPIKALVVLFHEVSHGLAAVATGGHILRIELSERFGGVCYFSGGIPAVSLPAGYLGSMLWGALLLLAGRSEKKSRAVAALLGFFLLGMTLRYIRTPLGIGVGIGWALAFMLLVHHTSARLTALVLQFIGLTSMLYAVVDIKEDLIDRTIPISDAGRFAQLMGGPPLMWGVIWIAIALGTTLLTLRRALKNA
jgi:hypothetical protein